MSRLLVWLGVLLGFAAAGALDAGWVLFWYVGRRELDLPLQVAADTVGLTLAGTAAGVLGRWLAGWTDWGVGMGIGVLLLAATALDLVLGVANAPWWHELLTAARDGPRRRLGRWATAQAKAPEGRLTLRSEMGFVLRLLVTAAALWVAVRLVPGIAWTGHPAGLIGVALVFGLLNALVRPILTVLTCPLVILTLGLFLLVLNGLMLWLTAALSVRLGLGFTVEGFLPALLGALVVSLTSALLSVFVGQSASRR